MSDDLELVRGNGNPFEDVGLPEAEAKLIRADLAAGIIAVMRERRLTGAAAAKLAGIQTAYISRVRNADLSRFTIDRLVTILNRLNRHVEVRFTVRAARANRVKISFPLAGNELDLAW
jgi:predicted XRE-type DNA-binding protein